MPIVLGVDGGGTKTMCAVARDGVVIGSATTGASNLTRVGDEEARLALVNAIRAACQTAGITPSQVEAACFGIGGAARESVSTRIMELVNGVLDCPVEVVGDMVIAYDAAMRGEAGVVVIAGTGSIAYGHNERGETARAGGWGSVISDEGSGYWIGRSAVSQAFRALDCGRSTVLIRYIMDRWRVITREDLIAYANSNPQPNFAELAPAVFEAAAQGDTISQELLSDAGSELAKMAKAVIRRLWPGSQALQVAALGGIFNHSKFVYKVFENSIRSERAAANVRLLAEDPVQGAIFRAEKMLADAQSAGDEP